MNDMNPAQQMVLKEMKEYVQSLNEQEKKALAGLLDRHAEAGEEIFLQVYLDAAQSRGNGMITDGNEYVQTFVEGLASEPHEYMRLKNIKEVISEMRDLDSKGLLEEKEPYKSYLKYSDKREYELTKNFKELFETPPKSLPSAMQNLMANVKEKTEHGKSIDEIVFVDPEIRFEIVCDMIMYESQQRRDNTIDSEKLTDRLLVVAKDMEDGYAVQNSKLEKICELINEHPNDDDKRAFAAEVCSGRDGGLPKGVLDKWITEHENNRIKKEEEERDEKEGVNPEFDPLKHELNRAGQRINTPRLRPDERLQVTHDLLRMAESHAHKRPGYYGKEFEENTNSLLRGTIIELAARSPEDRKKRVNDLMDDANAARALRALVTEKKQAMENEKGGRG